MIIAQASNACTIKNCKVAGTINKERETTVISADNYDDWMCKGFNTSSSKAIVQNCGYNAE